MTKTMGFLGGLLPLFLLTGCAATVTGDKADYVGEYIFTRDATVPGQFADLVVLKTDGSAIEVRLDNKAQRVLLKDTQWSFEQGGPSGDAVVISGFRHPVRKKGSSLQLAIDIDRDEYYEKIR